MIMKRVSNIELLSRIDAVYRIVSQPFAFFNYVLTTRILKLPYFGIWMESGQGNPLRHSYMREAVKRCASERASENRNLGQPFRVLEVGAYAGASAIEFATALREAKVEDFIIYSVDAWDAYLDTQKNNRLQYHLMNFNLARGNVLRLFIRNVRAAGVAQDCRQFRGRSDEILPMLLPEQFDFVYIDADHTPAAVQNDLRQSLRLLKPGGSLSGDDLERQMAELDADFVESHADSDIAMDPKSSRIFHPGVTIAVHNFFGRKVTNYDGFWVVGWTGQEFVDVELPSGP